MKLHHFYCPLVLGLVTITGCNSTSKISDADVPPPIKLEKLDALMNNAPKRTMLVDVRSPKRYAQGHLPKAINIPLAEIKEADPRLADAANIVVYSQHWNDLLSRAAAKKMIYLGYKNIHEFRGGTDIWQRNDRMLTTVTTAPTSHIRSGNVDW